MSKEILEKLPAKVRKLVEKAQEKKEENVLDFIEEL